MIFNVTTIIMVITFDLVLGRELINVITITCTLITYIPTFFLSLTSDKNNATTSNSHGREG